MIVILCQDRMSGFFLRTYQICIEGPFRRICRRQIRAMVVELPRARRVVVCAQLSEPNDAIFSQRENIKVDESRREE